MGDLSSHREGADVSSFHNLFPPFIHVSFTICVPLSFVLPLFLRTSATYGCIDYILYYTVLFYLFIFLF